MQLKNQSLLVMLLFAFGVMFFSSLGALAEEEVEDTLTPEEKELASPPGLGNPEVHKITEDIYAITGLYHPAGEEVGVSAGIIFTRNSVIFIDAGMTIASAEFLWQVAEKKMKGKEHLYLILTHRHSDHVFGMRVMKEKGAKVVAHTILRDWFQLLGGRYKQVIAQKMGWDREKGNEMLGDVLLFPPDQVIDRDTVLNIDGEEIHILVTPGHLWDELSIYHPKSRTLFAGDAIYEGMPPHTAFGGPDDWKLWVAQLQRLKELDIETVVPGHGKLCSKKEIDRNIAYLQEEISRTK